MATLLKNFVIVLVAMLVGAATMFGYFHYQPTLAAVAPLVASAAPSSDAARVSLFDEDAIAEIYDRVSPAVVNITSTSRIARSSSPFGDTPQFPGLPQLPQLPQPSQGAGSGIIVDDQGHVLTNNHVVEGADRIDVTLSDGNTVQAKLLGRDPGNDLAMLKIDVDKSHLAVAEFGDSSKLKAGQMAIAIGNPFGLSRTITVGVISSVGRVYSGGSGGRSIRNVIQTDAAINPGNSGGPLLNSKGEVIGITTAIESPVRGSVGIGFAVPINTAKLYMSDLIEGKAISHPWLGISGTPVTATVAKDLDVPAEGVYVVQVLPDSPAFDAGLKGAIRTRSSQTPGGQTPRGGDVILAVDGQKVSKVEEISGYLDTKKVGDTVTLTIRRSGETKEVPVTLGEWPDDSNQ